ncbi:Ribosomal protein L53 mitochondrial [Neofusicoccum parvum]|uniref:Large ribosomal subunit protein mL53 n=2 Tax=Neofusicoccum TaxID=407951 RepID=A0ABR3TC61_9PEZI|nr:Ribosomal protein L53 mitochondrial [Neofusicoccum parvum]GME64703.1 Ribosomal protein L53 mitochondrial [Neofusicoccum parvum]
MITRFLTEVNTKFNPFSRNAKTARNFLALLPPNARIEMKINAKMLPRYSKDPTTLELKFKDGKQMNLDLEKLKIREIEEEVNRHSRLLARQEELAG